MTARILTHPRFQRGPAIRPVSAADEALSLLAIAEHRTGIDARTATGEDLVKLTGAVFDVLAEKMNGWGMR